MRRSIVWTLAVAGALAFASHQALAQGNPAQAQQQKRDNQAGMGVDAKTHAETPDKTNTAQSQQSASGQGEMAPGSQPQTFRQENRFGGNPQQFRGSEQAAGPSNVTSAILVPRPQIQGSNEDWRFVQHNGTWWFWTPDSRWLYFQGGQWIPYGSTVMGPAVVGGPTYFDNQYPGGYYYGQPSYGGPYYGGYGAQPYYTGRYYYGYGPYYYNGYYGSYYGPGYGWNYPGYGYGRGSRSEQRGTNIGGAIGGAIGGPMGGQIGAGVGGAIGGRGR